jgi:hypothetical protein
MIRALVVVVLLCGLAIAKPPALVAVKTATYTVSLPKAWTVTPQDGGVVTAQQDPKRKDAAGVIVLLAPNTSGMTDETLLQLVTSGISSDLKVVQKKALPGGGQIVVSEGTMEGIKIRMVAIVAVTPQAALLALFVGKPADFDAMGAPELLTSVVASIVPDAPPPASAPVTAAPAAPAAPGAMTMPARMPSPADLAGEWGHDDSAFSNYVSSSTGQYAGYSAISYNERWVVDQKGHVQVIVHAYNNGRVLDEKRDETLTIAADGTVELVSSKGISTKYLLRGFTPAGDTTFMKLNGPWYDAGIPADVRADPGKGANLDQVWVRKPAKKK